MSRAVANTLLPAARPASTIARPRPRELPVTNHTCAIHPPLSSHPGYSGEASQTQDWMRNGYTKLDITAKFEAGLDEVKNSVGMNHALRNLRPVESSVALKSNLQQHSLRLLS